jgi:hypothetical protein
MWKDGFSLYIQCVGLQASLVTRFGQSHGVEDAGGDAVAVGRAQDFRLARVGGGVCRPGRKAR